MPSRSSLPEKNKFFQGHSPVVRGLVRTEPQLPEYPLEDLW